MLLLTAPEGNAGLTQDGKGIKEIETYSFLGFSTFTKMSTTVSSTVNNNINTYLI